MFRPSPQLLRQSHHVVHAIITGGGSGIGAAIAARFAAGGMRCTLVGRSRERLDGVVESISLRNDNNNGENGKLAHRAIVGDVRDREFWRGVKDLDADVLVNAAGITHRSLLVRTEGELVEEVVDTNLMGTIWGCQYMAKGMMRRKRGCIINISSLLGVKGGRGSAAYAASKAGVIGLTRALAAESGPHVRVNAIVPGYIKTPMTVMESSAGAPDQKANEQISNTIPLRRFGEVDEVADAAMFLFQNKYANNCVLNLDGGLSAI